MINVPEQIRQICLKDNSNKNFRVRFIDGELPDLINGDIVSESVSFTESLSSGGFRFGACEASVLEFDCKCESKIKGKEVDAWLEVDISHESADFIAEHGQHSDDLPFPYYPIYYGRFMVDSCKRNNDGLMHVEAFTQLLGDDRKADNRTIKFGQYGLSEFEIKKMELEVGNADYRMPLVPFVYSNLDGMTDLSDLPYEDYVLPEVTTDTRNITVAIDGKRPSETPYIIKAYVERRDNYNSRITNNQQSFFCFIGTDNQFDVLNAVVKKYYGEGAYADNKNIYLGREAYVFLENNSANPIIQSPVKGFFNPYVSATSTEMSRYRWWFTYENLVRVTVEDSNGTIIDEVIYDGETASLKKVIVDEYSYYPVSAFPRTVTTKTGKTTHYSLDYLALLNGGFEVVKKDKKGNAQTASYQFSFMDLIESYFEIRRMFCRDWRSTKGYTIKELRDVPFFLYPRENLYPSSTYDIDGLTPNGHAFHIPTSVIESVGFEADKITPYGKVVCTCSPSDATAETFYEVEVIDTSEMEEEEYLVYDISSNFFVKTANTKKSDIEYILGVIAYGLEELKFTNSSINTLGIPFVEVGDYISYETKEGSITALVTRQTITGVQHVRTQIESEV